MSRRVISLLLAAVLLMGTVVFAAPSVSAAYDWKASEEIIALIKEFEGFAPFPVGDYGHYSIGYGSACKLSDYPNGISREEADLLMRKTLAEFEKSLNYFAKRYKLDFTQNEFDALLSFTYNLGPNWMNQDSLLRQAIIDRARGNDFLYAFTMWCTAGTGDYKQILNTLVERRLIEANVFLNGEYSEKVSSRFDVVYFNNNITDAEGGVRIQGYDSVRTAPPKPTPSKSGYRFLGWYTKATGGEWVSVLDGNHAGEMLFAHWQKGNGDGKGVSANYQRITTMKASIYDLTTNKVVGEIPVGKTVRITADYLDGNGIKWGKTADGWIKLSMTRATNEILTEEGDGDVVYVTVTNGDGVNIRKGPGTNFDKMGRFAKGKVVAITVVQQDKDYTWGKCADGWICLKYTDYDQILTETPPEDEVVTAIGTIARCDSLRVRNRPGTSGTAVIGSYNRGDKVTITLQEKVGNTMWGKTPKGWISLFYVDLKPVKTEEPEEPTAPEEPTTPVEPTVPEEPATPVEPTVPEEPTTPAEPTEPVIPEEPTEPAEKVIATGVIVDTIRVRIRKGPGTNYPEAGYLACGTPIEIYETKGSGQQMWARIEQGWVSMNYVELDLETPESGKGTPGIVYNCSAVNIRKGPGTHYPKVGKLNAGTKVEYFETTVVKGVVWARISIGWVSMEYISVEVKPEDKPSEDPKPQEPKPEEPKPEAPKPQEPAPEQPKPETGAAARIGTVVNATEVKIRAGAGTRYDKVGTAKKGERLMIFETAKVGGALWGRTEKGWIHMYYVQLANEELPDGAVLRTVKGSFVNIRAGAGTNYERIGQYKGGETVVIYEQTTVKGTVWGRTDIGWISMDYVK